LQGVQLLLPGGGGFGVPWQRHPEAVLANVVNGYVSLEAAQQDYRVAIQYLGDADRLVRLPSDSHIDWQVTERLRGDTTHPG
jgi:N-methylhydantoinase B